MSIKTKSIIILILLGIVDAAIPIPIIGMICLYAFVLKNVRKIYVFSDHEITATS